MMLCFLTFEYLLKFYLTRTNMMQEGDHEIYKNAPVFVQIFRSDRIRSNSSQMLTSNFSLKTSHDIVILSFCNIVKGQANSILIAKS